MRDTGWDSGDVFPEAEDTGSRPRFLGSGGKTGTFNVYAHSTGAGWGTRDPFLDTWNDRMGDLYPLPEFGASTVGGGQCDAGADHSGRSDHSAFRDE